jgi:hypothetical protein
MKLLLCIDMQNLWVSCCEQYGKRSRVNLSGLVGRAKSHKNDTVSTVVFVTSCADKNQDNLLKKLSELGFDVISISSPDGLLTAMCDFVKSHIDEYDGLVVGSGDPILAPVVQIANQCNKDTKLIGFCNGMNSVLAAEADGITLLDKRDIIVQ